MSVKRCALLSSNPAGPDELRSPVFFERGDGVELPFTHPTASRNVKLLSALPFSFNFGSGLTIHQAHACVFYAR